MEEGSSRFRLLVGRGTGALAHYLEEYLSAEDIPFLLVSPGLYEVYLTDRLS